MKLGTNTLYIAQGNCVACKDVRNVISHSIQVVAGYLSACSISETGRISAITYESTVSDQQRGITVRRGRA